MPDDRLIAIETLLLAINFSGPHEVCFHHRESLRRLYREDWPAWLQVMSELRHCGMPLHEIMDAVVDEHPGDCACWRCIWALKVEIIETKLLFTHQPEGLDHAGRNERAD